jgi:hypothetical protein
MIRRNQEGRWRPRWNMGPRELERLQGKDAQKAWDMWQSGRLDTKDIADRLDVPEHQVFNTVRLLRECERIQFGAVPRADSGRALCSSPGNAAIAPGSAARPLPFREGR